ncbi:MAG TPA: serine--tRNA ligase, partial [Salibaculum sp.]|nr:serine--tRNA ligase [Salibaculum sp.]
MHDIRMIRETPDAFDAVMARRGLSPVSGDILALDEKRRAKILAAEEAQ